MTFRLRLLGRFQLLSATGESIAITSRKHQALIAMLALSNGKPISRSKLAGLLWAERPEDQARNNLRQAFFTIRHAVEGHGPSPFMIDNESGWIADGEVATDIQGLLEGARMGLVPPEPDAFDGEFLEGVSFKDETLEAWLRIERDRHHNLLVDCLTSLTERLERAGDAAQALLAAQCLLRHDPYHEPSHRVVLRHHLGRGDRARAIRYYDTLKTLFEVHLGVLPDAETQQLANRIRDPQSSSVDLANSKPRVAILPIISLSAGGDHDIIDESLTRKLIGELGRFSPISVVAAATMLAVGARQHTIAEIGQQVGADYVVEIAVQERGGTGWTLVQLIAVQSGTQIWSRKYSSVAADLSEASEAQDALARRISGNLYQTIMRQAANQSATEPEETMAGGKLYLQIFSHVERPTLNGMIRARRLCDRLLAIDPNHVLVRESLAWISFHCCFNGWTDDPLRGFSEARDVALTGLALDEREPYLLSALGLAETYLGNIRSGLDSLKRAVDLNPNDAEFHTWLGIGLTFAGRIDEAQAAFDQADQASPDYPPIFLFRGDAHLAAADHEAAVSCLDRFLTVLPEYNWGRLLRAAAHEALGNAATARQEVSHVRANAARLDGHYIERLLQARATEFRQKLWSRLEVAGLPWSG
ncbi:MULTISPECIES: BTAD domain-containing putative transcriptional regulator [unclassified Sinorhizobium]|uniref:BTAD domain-containing putative transcriptional regulator n=1 Tax=unclassified Sinorhizobium TaxID=2613772 RepID=UPI0024C3D993|nr:MULTISPECIES: BTAD domain-containing putative transcriptional regulator [unclassified Sinorhizobium]MDK1373277.1 BTAD domain-containing putative transcriptional regulator [Sinorhizobium sp. 6-70]MDK1479123.1 BTAD domain-containing putative transcriptional regulator [Sinorhizobium sp. 6-117]